MRPATEEENRAYIAGLCVVCKVVPYSARRPRCNDCHHAYIRG